MPSWHCIRASEPVRLENRQQKKVARCNWRSNLPRYLALIHDRGMKQHKAEGQKANIRLHENEFP